MKIVFFGTSNVALPILEALNKHHEILKVITSPDAPVGKKQIMQESPVSALVNELHIPLAKPVKVKGNTELFAELRELAADIFIVVSYGKILPEELLNIPPLKTLNVHFSLLPKYRGASPLQFAILNGETETGTTIFVLDKDLDHGPILSQEKIKIDEDDSFVTLADKSARASAALLLNTLEDYKDGKLKPKEQDHTQATFSKIIEKQDGKIDWNKSAGEIYNLSRAFYPWPGIFTTWKDKTLKIQACHVIPDINVKDSPGKVLENGVVLCGNGTGLFISELQLAGKNTTNIKDFLNGYKDFVGTTLGI